MLDFEYLVQNPATRESGGEWWEDEDEDDDDDDDERERESVCVRYCVCAWTILRDIERD